MMSTRPTIARLAPGLALGLVCGLITLSGCVESLPAQDQPCPCGDGFYCDRSAGEPGFCRAGDPKDPCLQPRVIDRFDDEHLDDWTVDSPDATIVDGRLLAERTASSGLGDAVRKLELSAGGVVLEVDVTLKESSWARASIATATGDAAFSMLLSNNDEGTNRMGFFLKKTLDPGVNGSTPPAAILIEKAFMPETGKTYHLRVAVSASGEAELFLDGERVGKAQTSAPPAFARVYLGGGQNSDEKHGGYFDNLVIRGCPIPAPKLVPDAKNPVFEGPTVLAVHHDGSLYRAFLRNTDAEPNTIHIETSPDGITWGNRIENVLDGTHSGASKYITHIAAIKTPEGKLRVYLTAGSGDCHEFNKIYLAESDDGVSWTSLGVVLETGPLGSFDSRTVSSPQVLYDGTRYHLFHNGEATSGGDQCILEPPHYWRTGVAHLTSDDGENWTRHGLAFELGLADDLDSQSATGALVYRQGGAWRALYNTNDGKTQAIHVATSPDGLAWTKQGVVLEGVHTRSIVERNGKIEVFYGCGSALCRAELQPSP